MTRGSVAVAPALLALAGPALAHSVAEGDKGYIQEITGVNLLPFIYLGAKHMVTGYDHILFLLCVIFFLYKLGHIAIYFSLFAIGHSTTMLLGVYFNVGINSYLIDAIIGLSVYKAMDNLGAFQRWFGVQHDKVDCRFLKVWRIAVASQLANLDPHLRSHALFSYPVDRRGASYCLHKHLCENAELLMGHQRLCRSVLGQSIVERQFLGIEPQLGASGVRRADVLSAISSSITCTLSTARL